MGIRTEVDDETGIDENLYGLILRIEVIDDECFNSQNIICTGRVIIKQLINERERRTKRNALSSSLISFKRTNENQVRRRSFIQNGAYVELDEKREAHNKSAFVIVGRFSKRRMGDNYPNLLHCKSPKRCQMKSSRHFSSSLERLES